MGSLVAPDADIAAVARRLTIRVAALPEPHMRRVAVAGWMRTSELDEQVETLAYVVARGRGLGPAFQTTLLALVAVLSAPDDIPYARRRELYVRCKLRGHDLLAQLLLSAANRGAADSPSRELELRGRPLTLGERKSL